MVQQLKNNVEAIRRKQLAKKLGVNVGAVPEQKMKIEIIDFGPELYWGDFGQLKKARQSYDDLRDPSDKGDFARKLVDIDDIKPDAFGNIVVNSDIPLDGSVRNSVVINTTIAGKAKVDGAVLINSEFGDLKASEGAVAVESTIGQATLYAQSFSYKSLKEKLVIEDNWVHTSIPNENHGSQFIMEDWHADLGVDVGSKLVYDNRQLGNPRSFREEQLRVRNGGQDPDLIEEKVRTLFQDTLHTEIIDRRKASQQAALADAMARPAVTSGLPLDFDRSSNLLTNIKGLPRLRDVLPDTSKVADVTRQFTVLLNVQNNVFNPEVREAASFLQALAFFRQLLPDDRDKVLKIIRASGMVN